MASDREKKEVGMGFSGLSSLVSDVDNVITGTKQDASRPTADEVGTRNAETTSQPVPTEEPESKHQLYQQAAQQPSGGSSTGKWLLGIGAVIGVLWLLSSSPGNKSAPPIYTSNPTVPPAPALNIEPAPVQPQASLQSGSLQNATTEELAARMLRQVPSKPQAPHRPIEDKPPVGANNVLGADQIRYCLSEDIRLGAAKQVLNNYVKAEVDRFNSLVTDYNSRCGQFRYRRGLLESVRSEVESNRSSLQAEGIARFRQHNESRRKEQHESVANANPVISGITSQPDAPKPASPMRHNAGAGREVSLEDLSRGERQSIESACSTDKYVNGPAAYNACLARQLSLLRN